MEMLEGVGRRLGSSGFLLDIGTHSQTLPTKSQLLKINLRPPPLERPMASGIYIVTIDSWTPVPVTQDKRYVDICARVD